MLIGCKFNCDTFIEYIVSLVDTKSIVFMYAKCVQYEYVWPQIEST